MSSSLEDGPPTGVEPAIYGGPTKRFFVSMLTKDIELKDAILDLLDNCVDGAIRVIGHAPSGESPYTGFGATIVANPERFEIEDNCGGIPREIAERSAFALGRPDLLRDANLPTIGMYGIGMKRAIFKMGRDAEVLSSPQAGAFSVRYTPEWMDSEDSWNLPVDENPSPLDAPGTKIVVRDLVPATRDQFTDEEGFIADLREAISVYYGYIMRKGFSVSVNNEEIQPQVLRLFSYARDGDAKDEDVGGDTERIEPYFFSGEIEGVRITVSVGFRRPLPSEMEVEDEQLAPRSSDEAGISIICNDRVVLLNDKSRLTGWGDGSVPKYHNQFISIGGEATFYSANAANLPLTTTKRGVDAATEVYLAARSYMIEGLKLATNFTNKWKGMEDRTEEYFRQARPIAVRDFETSVSQNLSRVREFPSAGRFLPKLPVPRDTNPGTRISFSRPLSEVKAVASYLFDDPDTRPRVVGEECFDQIRERAKK